MPLLSCFTPCGMLSLSSQPSHAENFYDQLKQLYGESYDFTPGPTNYDEARLYAMAMALARAQLELEHAGNQAYPLRAYDLLPLLEREFLLTPGPNDNIPTRQAAVAAAQLLPVGARASNVVNVLKGILGSAFLSYVLTDPIGSTGPLPSVWPSSSNTSGLYSDIRTPNRYLQLVDPVTNTGSMTTQWCAYKNLDTTTTAQVLRAGELVMVQGENSALCELVQVLSVASSPPAGSNASAGTVFQGTFLNAHGPGATVIAGTFPYWVSTQRHAVIVVTSAAALDPNLRRKINEAMAKMARGVSSWSIVQPTGLPTATGGTVGPLTVGAPMGVVHMAAQTYSNSM